MVEVAIRIGETLGAVIKPKDTGEMKYGSFMRVLVEVDINKPLCSHVGDRKSHVSKKRMGGLHLCMNSCQIFVIGVATFLMMTKTVSFGLVARAP